MRPHISARSPPSMPRNSSVTDSSEDSSDSWEARRSVLGGQGQVEGEQRTRNVDSIEM